MQEPEVKNRKSEKYRELKNGLLILPFVIGLFVLTSTVFTSLKAKEASAKTKGTSTKAAETKSSETKSDERTEQKTEAGKSGKEDGRSTESSLIQLLEKKKAELDARDIELNEREMRLNQMSKEIDGKIANYGKMREQLESSFKKADTAQGEKVSGLVKIYEAMPPKEAAVRMQELDRDIVLTLLAKMKPKVAAKILAFIDPAIAADLSRGMVGASKVPKLK